MQEKMIDIKEIAKIMTKEEFLTQACQINLGILNQKHDCPHLYKLKSSKRTGECLGHDLFRCRECWEKAVKDIKFKGDVNLDDRKNKQG